MRCCIDEGDDRFGVRLWTKGVCIVFWGDFRRLGGEVNGWCLSYGDICSEFDRCYVVCDQWK